MSEQRKNKEKDFARHAQQSTPLPGEYGEGLAHGYAGAREVIEQLRSELSQGAHAEAELRRLHQETQG